MIKYFLLGFGCKSYLLAPILFLFLYIESSHCRNNFEISNARSAGMSGIKIGQQDQWSLFGNQADLAYQNAPSFGLHYENYYSISELNRCAVVALIPLQHNRFGFGFSYFGNTGFNQSSINLAYARSLGDKLKAGIGFEYYRFQSGNETAVSDALIGNLGSSLKLNEEICIGIHWHNLSGNTLQGDRSDEIPSYLTLGALFEKKLFTLAAEFESDFRNKSIIRVGSDIQLKKGFQLRMGVSNAEYASYSFGLGFCFTQLKADLAFSSHPYLGLSPFLTLSYLLSKDG